MTDIARPSVGAAGWARDRFLANFAALARVGRAVWPIASIGGAHAVLLYDDVRAVFERDADFEVVYAERLNLIMGGEPFFLGMGDGPRYRRDTGLMRAAMPAADIPARLVPACAAVSARRVEAAAGAIEVVEYVRRVTEDVLCAWLGVPAPPGQDIALWAARLFEYQFVTADPPLVAEVNRIAPALRDHVDTLIAGRRSAGTLGDDVLGRALALVSAGGEADDVVVRTALVGFIVGGLPQPPMVAPQALNQLLLRPAMLRAAGEAARADDDVRLANLVFEALRFDPLAPFLTRRATRDTVIAPGTRRATRVRQGEQVMASFHSAMHDARRVRDPARFDPERPANDYLHFGHALHECFGRHIVTALMPLMLKPLLARPNLRRAGRLVKRGPFAHRLNVTF